jgi:Flp pilus assembly pilin Flp
MKSTAGRVLGTVLHLRRSEKAQGLVEYALIIAIVAIGAIVSMTFLRKEIRSTFFASGNVLQGTVGFPLGGSGGDPPNNGAPINMGPGGTTPSFNDGTGVIPIGSAGGPGVYVLAPPNGVHTNTPCTFTQGGYTFTGHWVNGFWVLQQPPYLAFYACQGVPPTAPPAPGINTRPSDPTTDTTPTWTYDDQWNWVTFECQIDGGAFAPCGGPGSGTQTFTVPTPPPPTTHTFSVRAVDSSDPTAIVRSGATTDTFTVSQPVVTITQNPTDPAVSSTATFRFTSSPAATSYSCTVSGTGGSTKSCTPNTNVTFTNLAVGSHTFTVTPTPAGTDDTYTWNIVPPAPTVSIRDASNCAGSSPAYINVGNVGTWAVRVTTSAAQVGTATVNLTVHSSGGGSDVTKLQANVNPNTAVCFTGITPLSDGNITASATITQNSVTSAAGTDTAVKDTQPPTAPTVTNVTSSRCPTYSGARSNTAGDSAVTYVVAGTGGGTYTDNVTGNGGATWSDAPSGNNTRLSVSGSYTVTPRQTDAAGNLATGTAFPFTSGTTGGSSTFFQPNRC